MKDTFIHLGYSIPNGDAVSVPLGHMVVVGQTQRSGKTTTMEALISRAPQDLRAVAFLTKRGEESFTGAKQIPPYFREHADWQFVESVLEAAMRQRLKPHRSFIMKVTSGQTTLKGVHKQVKTNLKKARAFAESIYTELDAYLDIVIPQVERIKFSKKVQLHPGINVVDLTEFSPEMQALVIRSVLEWIYENEKRILTIVPEAWELLPQGRNSPVKAAAEMLIRKGGVLQNFMWFDTQDTAGVDKLALRAARTWLLGVQRERNEIERTLKSIPAGIKAPKAQDVATLGVGQFYACYDKVTTLTYVQPTWMRDHDARDVAQARDHEVSELLEEIRHASIPEYVAADFRNAKPELSFPGGTNKDLDDWVSEELDKDAYDSQLAMEAEEELLEDDDLEAEEQEMEEEVDIAKLDLSDLSKDQLQELQLRIEKALNTDRQPMPVDHGQNTAAYYDLDQIYGYVVKRASKDPNVMRLLDKRPVLEVEILQEVITAESGTLRGAIAKLIIKGFFADYVAGFAVVKDLRERQKLPYAQVTIYSELDTLTRMGFLEKNAKKQFRLVEGAIINVKKG